MLEFITSPQNQLIKQVCSLQYKKHRDKQGLFVVEGVRLIEEASQSDWQIAACIYSEDIADNARVQAVISRLASSTCRIVKVPRHIYDRISDTEQPQGILAIVHKRHYSLAQVINQQTSLISVLDNLQDPGNVGTLIRTADAAGCDCVILSAGCADIYANKTVRATMGSVFHLPIVSNVALEEFYPLLKRTGIRVVATSLDSDNLYFQTEFIHNTAVVFGNEGNGVSATTLSYADGTAKIPIYGQAESLNVAAAAAIIFYEAVRQRRVAGN